MMKPRVLLVNPPVYDFTAYDFWLKPYGLLEIGGFLRGRAEMKLFDYLDRTRMPETARSTDKWGRGKFFSEEINKPTVFFDIKRRYHRFGLKRELFRKFLAGNGPFDFALVQTVMTYWYPGVKEAIDDIRQISPKTRIILGGVYATLCPSHAESLGADLVIKGIDLSSLCKLIGIEFDTKQPAFWQGYWQLETGVLRLSDGCPFVCTYCSVPMVYQKFTPRLQDKYFQEFELLKSKGVRNIAFYDDALLYQPDKSIVPFLNHITQTGNDINLHTPNALNVRFISPELAKLMVKSNVKTFYLGFESMSAEWQTKTGGKVNREDLANAVNNLFSAGTEPENIFAYIIVGHPDDDIQQVKESMEFAHGLGIKIMLSEYSPVPGTPDGEKCRKFVDFDEPLTHNKTAFAIRTLGEEKIQHLKSFCKELNGKK
ncbi:MAG: B12-binding domain-containing radical SAM protein [Kiritimatiellae bacterium]|nr:B12-binding domain-containing radical SAM protein [Kiritimatiellia bacterium]MDD5519984.1 B12-binding domain-containing radical SAM protein [Kiritimatiellia bacterium]